MSKNPNRSKEEKQRLFISYQKTVADSFLSINKIDKLTLGSDRTVSPRPSELKVDCNPSLRGVGCPYDGVYAFPSRGVINHRADETVNVYDTTGAFIIGHRRRRLWLSEGPEAPRTKIMTNQSKLQ